MFQHYIHGSSQGQFVAETYMVMLLSILLYHILVLLHSQSYIYMYIKSFKYLFVCLSNISSLMSTRELRLEVNFIINSWFIITWLEDIK